MVSKGNGKEIEIGKNKNPGNTEEMQMNEIISTEHFGDWTRKYDYNIGDKIESIVRENIQIWRELFEMRQVMENNQVSLNETVVDVDGTPRSRLME